MTPLFRKLNLKEHQQIVVLNSPPEFDAALEELSALTGVRVVRTVADAATIAFGVAFAITQDELDRVSRDFTDRAEDNAVLWFCYPKKSSKRYACEFNRDSGWNVLASRGYEGVRQVAIDEDWSALRFRPVADIRSFTRDERTAISKEGKARSETDRDDLPDLG